MKIVSSIRRLLQHPTKGQSLVEMAITAPILIFMMIGLFEVGWALRGYLVLTNVNREITRFAVRPGYLNFSTKPDVITSYQRVRDWVDTANSGQLALDFSSEVTGNATLIVSHIVVDTGNPYDINDNATDNPATEWDCEALDTPGVNPFPIDDIIIHPGDPPYTYQAVTYPVTRTDHETVTTRIDYASLVSESLVPQNNKFNCEIIKKGGVASANNVIITEMFFDQPQLLGFPLIANPFTDPVPMYAHTSMRLSAAARSAGKAEGSLIAGIDNIGPICIAHPLTVKDTDLPPVLTPDVTVFDILGGPTVNDAGWLAWNPQDNNVPDLELELEFPQTSLNNYFNADPNEYPDDRNLTIGDWVASLEGINGGVNDSDHHLVDDLIGAELIIPVHDEFRSNWGAGNVDVYHIVRFIRVSIISGGINLTASGGGPSIMAVYKGEAIDNCQ